MAPALATLNVDPAASSGAPFLEEIGLAPARLAIEGRFLEAGDILAAAVQGIGDLISALAQLSETLSAETLAATTADLSHAATELLGLTAAHDARRRRIEELTRANAAVGDCMEEMQSTLAYLRIYAVNIKITSGGIVAAGPAFTSFGQEIADRIALGREQLNAFGRQLEELDATLDSAMHVEADLGRYCHNILPAVPNSLLASSEALNSHHARVAGIASDVSAVAKDVQRKVGRTLSALQIGDITRQRIEHVEFGLDALANSAALADVSDDQRQRITDAVLWLLQAQLGAAISDFHQDAAVVSGEIADIAQDAAAILRLKDIAAEGGQEQSSNVLQELADTVDQALQVVARTNVGVRAAEAVSRSGVDAARALGGRIAEVQSMRADVQMMAMNTSLRCARIGDAARPLNVIAMELRQHADNLETSAELTTTALRGLANHADSSAQSSGQSERPAATAAALTDAVSRIRTASSSLDRQLEAVADQGNAVVRELSAGLGRLNFQTDLGVFLDAAMDRLRQAIGPRDVAYDRVDRDVLEPIMASLSAAYTMAQERQVHRDVLEELGLPELETRKPQAAMSPSDDFDLGLF